MNKQIVLGDKIKDLVSGFQGIATCEVKYMNGCEKWGIDGKVVNGNIECIWVDKTQCVKVSEGVRKHIEAVEKTALSALTGGPTVSAPRERRPS